MCVGSRPTVPDPQPIQQPPTQQDPVVSNAAKSTQQKSRAAYGAGSTILTSPGDTNNNVPLLGKTALGQ